MCSHWIDLYGIFSFFRWMHALFLYSILPCCFAYLLSCICPILPLSKKENHWKFLLRSLIQICMLVGVCVFSCSGSASPLLKSTSLSFFLPFSLLLSPAQTALCMFYMCLINGSMDDLCITFFFPGRYIFVLIRMKIHANFSFFLLALGFDGSKHLLCLCLFAPFFCLQNLSSGEII